MSRLPADVDAASIATTNGCTRVADMSALGGGVAWFGLVADGRLGPIGEILALAVLVLVPLGLRLTDAPRADGTRSPWYVLAVLGQPVAAVPAIASLALPVGPAALALALPLAGVTACAGVFGVWRLRRRGPWPVAEAVLDAGLLYLAIGGGALLLDRAGVHLFFDPVVMTLTAVHYYYAGFALPVAVGLAGRRPLPDRLDRPFRAATVLIAAGPGLIGFGFTIVALAVPYAAAMEFVAVSLFTTAVAVCSLSVLAGVVPGLSVRPQQLLLGAASLAVTASMGFAVLYGLSRLTGGTYLGIHAEAFGTMIRYHGHLNAYGFALPALVGWRLSPPPAPGTVDRSDAGH